MSDRGILARECLKQDGSANELKGGICSNRMAPPAEHNSYLSCTETNHLHPLTTSPQPLVRDPLAYTLDPKPLTRPRSLEVSPRDGKVP